MRDVGKRGAASATDRDWEQFARRDPYFAVLTEERFRGATLSEDTRSAFFATGARHVEAIFDTIAAGAGQPYRPRRALDFGCGVGRVLAALSPRCAAVVGADVAATMLAEAHRHCVALALGNVSLVRVDDSLATLEGSFDLIHAAMVFQHVETRRGERLMALLCARLRPGGVAVLHFPTLSRVSRWASVLARVRRDFRPLHAALNLAAGRDRSYPLMQMHVYDRGRLARIAAAAGCVEIAAQPWRESLYDGVLLFLRRPAADAP